MINNLYDLLQKQATLHPTKTAIIDEKNYTYWQFLESVLNFAAVLRSNHAIKKGSIVGIFLPNVAAYAISIFAINKIGAVSSPINIRLDSKTIKFILQKAKVKLVVTNKEFGEKLAETRLPIGVIVIEDKRDYFYNQNLPKKIIEKERSIKSPSRRDDVAIVMFTSGTTGTPKGAMITNSNLFFNCRSCKFGFNLSARETHIVVVPLFHVTGLNSQLLASIYMGNTTVLLEKYHTEDVINLLEKYKVTIFIAVPSVFILLLEKFQRKFANLTYLKKIGYAGAPMPTQVIKDLKKLRPNLECYNFYGLTETSSITTVLPNKYALETPDSVGIPTPGIQVKVIDDKGKTLKNGQVGELFIKGGNIVKGYLHNERTTQKTIVNGWLHSGDLVRIDRQGRVFLMGRIKEIINRGGEKIYPVALENKLYNHPKILEAAVVGIPHRIFGEVVRSCIVKKPRVKLSKKEVLTYCRANFAEYEMPEEIIFLDKLPKNANGKVQKSKLVTL